MEPRSRPSSPALVALIAAFSVACGPDTVTLPAGTALVAELDRAVSADTGAVGDTVSARLAGDLTGEGRILLPAGTVLRGRITAVQAADDRRPAAVKLDFHALGTEGGTDSLAVRVTSAETEPLAPADGEGEGSGVTGSNLAGTVVTGRKHAPMVTRELARAGGTGILLGTPVRPAHLPRGARLELELSAPLEVVPPGPAE